MRRRIAIGLAIIGASLAFAAALAPVSVDRKFLAGAAGLGVYVFALFLADEK